MRNRGKKRMNDIGGKRIRRTNDNWFKLDFVEDVVSNILSRLPVRSLGICKTVCKRWHGLIRSPHFFGLQLSWSRENPIYIVYPYIDEIMTLFLMKGNGEIFEEITLPGFEDLSSPNMICSYNGLICCTSYVSPSSNDMDVRICNPLTRDVLLLPNGSPTEEVPSFGVAFGPRINEYKIFRFFTSTCESQDEQYECEVYSSVSGSWRGKGSVTHCPMGSSHVFVNRRVYWFVSAEEDYSIPGSILSVDMEENFLTIDLPDEATEHSFLVDLGGCLSLIIVYDEDEELVDIWVLQDPNESTWVKKCSDNIPIESIECVDSAAVRNNEIFFATTDHYLILNLDDKTWRELDLADSFESNFTVAFPFTESLLPCNGVLGP